MEEYRWNELKSRIQRELNNARILLSDHTITQEFKNQLSHKIIVLSEVLSWMEELETQER